MRCFVLCLALVVFVLPGCGPGQECAIDTDCPFAMNAYCSAEHVCVPRGTTGDAGPPRDVGGGETGPGDVGVTDAPRTDTPADAPMAVCPAVNGTYPLTSVGIDCTRVVESMLTLDGPASATDCSFAVLLDSRNVGVAAYDDGTTLSGTLSVNDPPERCTLVFTEDLASVAVTCGRCMFTAGRL